MRLVWGQGWQAPLSVPSAVEGSARFIFRINLHDELFIPPGIQGNDKVLRAKLCWSQAEFAGLPDVDLFRPAPRRCLRGLPVPALTKDGVCAMDHSILASCLLDRRLFKCHEQCQVPATTPQEPHKPWAGTLSGGHP